MTLTSSGVLLICLLVASTGCETTGGARGEPATSGTAGGASTPYGGPGVSGDPQSDAARFQQQMDQQRQEQERQRQLEESFRRLQQQQPLPPGAPCTPEHAAMGHCVMGQPR